VRFDISVIKELIDWLSSQRTHTLWCSQWTPSTHQWCIWN